MTVSRPYNTAGRARQLTLVPPIEVQDADPDSYPRLGVPIIPDYSDDQTPDEQHATAHFLAWRRGETADFPTWFNGLGGDAA